MKTNAARKLRVLLAILYYPVMIFLQAARDVVTAMTGNTNYTTPYPPLLDITAALDDLENKITAAAGRDKTAIAARNAAWGVAKSLIRQLASYVQMHCQNDLTILLSSGFSATKTPAPIGPLSAPVNVRLERTYLSGQVRVRFQPVYGACGGYNVQTATSADGPFTDYATFSTTRNVLISGRTPMTTVWVRLRATGTAGTGPWSDPASIVAL